jgi:hypothetical protein
MSSSLPPPARSDNRKTLCSRAHADRIAFQLCDSTDVDVAVVRTGDVLQPYKVVAADDAPAHLTELEVRVL